MTNPKLDEPTHGILAGELAAMDKAGQAANVCIGLERADERVITFSPDGKVEFTRSPKLLSLFEGEHKSVKRMTEILFDEPLQKYYIRFLLGPFAGALAGQHGMGITPYIDVDQEVEFFETYEEAVAREIAIVDGTRACGYSMHQ